MCDKRGTKTCDVVAGARGMQIRELWQLLSY